MYYAVLAACDKHNAAWTGLPAFATGYRNSRAIVDSGGGRGGGEEEEESSSSSFPSSVAA